MAEANRVSHSSSNGLILAFAVWLFVSPWVLAAPAMGAWAWNTWVVAGALAVFSVIALLQLAQWEDWVNLALAAWLFFSPWIYGYTGMQSAAWSSYIVGVVIGLISIWGIGAAQQAKAHSPAQ